MEFKKHILGFIIGIGASLITYTYFVDDLPLTKRHKEELERIQIERDSLISLSKDLNEEIISLGREVDYYDSQIDSIIYRIETLNRLKDEQTRAINDFTIDQLQNFFSTRYKSNRPVSEELRNPK